MLRKTCASEPGKASRTPAGVSARARVQVDAYIEASSQRTTPSNTALVTSIECANSNSMSLHCLPLPPPGLPDGWDASASIGHLDFQNVHRAIALLRRPLHDLLADHQPECLISDMFLPRTADIAHELSIPRLVFHGMCFFSFCVLHHLENYRLKTTFLAMMSHAFIVPGLSHPIEMTPSQLPAPFKFNTNCNKLLKRMHETEANSYGMVVNSYYELHNAEHYTKISERKAWCVGPVSLMQREHHLPTRRRW